MLSVFLAVFVLSTDKSLVTLRALHPSFANRSHSKIIRPRISDGPTSRKDDSRLRLAMAGGLWGSFSKFLNDREGDFVKLEDSAAEYGPGPLLILYNVPSGIDDDEIQDMISDMAPSAYQKNCRLCRLSRNQRDLLDLSLEETLERAAKGQVVVSAESASVTTLQDDDSVPVLFFSGFRDDEMMALYNLVAQEIYQEMGGRVYPACAKAVPNAMAKPLRQVFDEVTGDHRDAIKAES